MAKIKWFKEMNAQHQKLVEVMKERDATKTKNSAAGLGVRTQRHRRSGGVDKVGDEERASAGGNPHEGGAKDSDRVNADGDGEAESTDEQKAKEVEEEVEKVEDEEEEEKYDDAKIKQALNRAIIQSKFSDSSDEEDEDDEYTPGPRARRHL